MKKTIGLLVVLSLAALPATAQKVYIDYAHDFDFESAETFQYVETKDSNVGSQLVDDRIKSLITKELQEGGARMVDSNPDLYITYHVTTEENKVYNTTSTGFGGYGGYYRGWGGWGGMGMSSAHTTESTFTDGTLIIDAYEPEEKKMVWRGTGTVTLKAKPEKQTKQVEKILAKMGKKWDKILAGQGK